MNGSAKKRKNNAAGQALPEYGLVLALITLFCIATVTFLGEEIRDFILDFANTVQNVQTAP